MSGIRNVFTAVFKTTVFFTGVGVVGFVANMDKLVPSADDRYWFEKILKN